MALAERELMTNQTHYNPLLGSFDEVYEQYKKMAASIAGKYFRILKGKQKDFRSLDYEDLYQVACEAMFESYRKYKTIGSITFNTHVYRTMQNRIRRYLNYKSQMIHIPVLKKKKVEIETLSYNKDGATTGNFHPEEWDPFMYAIESILAFKDDVTVERVKEFLSGIEERHAQAVMMRMEFYTMEEVGQALGTSRQRIHQMINKVREEYLFYEKHGRHRKRGEKL